MSTGLHPCGYWWRNLKMGSLPKHRRGSFKPRKSIHHQSAENSGRLEQTFSLRLLRKTPRGERQMQACLLSQSTLLFFLSKFWVIPSFHQWERFVKDDRVVKRPIRTSRIRWNDANFVISQRAIEQLGAIPLARIEHK